MAIKTKIKKNAVIKKGKKKWHPIHAPQLFGEALLGETYVYETSDIEGKYITANLSTITKNMRKQNANIQFKVVKVVEGKGVTKVIGYSMITAAVKRLVKRGRDKIADSFLTKSNDKQIIRVKPLSITANHTTNMIKSACRLETRKIVREFAFTKTAEQLIESIVSGKLQKLVKDGIKKIYPIKSVDIRMAKVEENTRIVITDKEIVSEPVRRRKLSNDKEGQKWKDTHKEETEELDYLEEETGKKSKKKEIAEENEEEVEETSDDSEEETELDEESDDGVEDSESDDEDSDEEENKED
ncbi:MAG: hypothetical protein AB7V77_04220 [Candidatus Woesearchaeota archaeon]